MVATVGRNLEEEAGVGVLLLLLLVFVFGAGVLTVVTVLELELGLLLLKVGFATPGNTTSTEGAPPSLLLLSLVLGIGLMAPGGVALDIECGKRTSGTGKDADGMIFPVRTGGRAGSG